MYEKMLTTERLQKKANIKFARSKKKGGYKVLISEERDIGCMCGGGGRRIVTIYLLIK